MDENVTLPIVLANAASIALPVGLFAVTAEVKNCLLILGGIC